MAEEQGNSDQHSTFEINNDSETKSIFHVPDNSALKMNRDERARVVSCLFHEGARSQPFVRRFMALMALSTLIAVLGLLADSTAVVIGAMVVAPLMAPVLGVSAALVMDSPRRALRSGLISLAGTIFSIALAALSAKILLTLRSAPIDGALPNEIMARTAPNMFDLGVALVAGAAGAYAQMRRQAADALIGVAVAVALVPPLGVIGITLQMGEWNLAIGGTLLFIANVAGIIAAGAVTFIWCGLVPPEHFAKGIPIGRAARGIVAFGALVLTPLALNSAWDQNRTMGDAEATEAVIAVLDEVAPDTDVISIEVESEEHGKVISITASDSGSELNADEVAAELVVALAEGVELKVMTLHAETTDAAVEVEPEDDGDGVVGSVAKAAGAGIGLGGDD